MRIEVKFENDGSITNYEFTNPPSDLSFLQIHRYTTSLLCNLKRKIENDKKILVLNQQLWFANRSNDFNDVFTSTVFPKLILTPRQRNPNKKIIITGWNEDEHSLLIDIRDTVLDVKFLLSNKLKTSPEYINLVVNFKKRLLNNHENIIDSGILSNDPKTIIHYWLEIPIMNKNKFNFIVRSTVNFDMSPPNGKTIGEYFRYCCKKYGNRNHLGIRKFNNDGSRGSYEYITFNQLYDRVRNFSSGLLSLGLKQGNETRIGICSANRPEWVIADYSNHYQGFITVPLYDTLSKNAISYIVNHSYVVAVCTTKEVLTQVLKAKDNCKTLKYIILMDDNPDDKLFVKNNRNIGFTHTFSELENIGKNKLATHYNSKESDLCTICYTSGTTGDPKGAMITHKNMMTSIGSFIPRVKRYFTGNSDRVLSYLPLAHMYEKLVELLMLSFGAEIGYWVGDKLKLAEDLAELKPTFFAGVPRVYQKFQDKIMAQVNSSNFIKKYLFNKAFNSKSQALAKREEPNKLFDKLVFSKIGEKFGGRIITALSGSAPLSINSANFLRVVFTPNLGEGYGLTETVAAGSSTSALDTGTFGHVGAVSGCVEMKLMDVEDMNYFVCDEPEPRGEIWLRGPSIFKGYYRNKELSDKVLTSDGWFCTGDIGKWRLDGKLQIIDRKKNIFKLAQGEYIRPEYIENVYKMSIYIGNIFVHGNSSETYLVGIVYPDPETIIQWASLNGLKSLNNNWNELYKHPKIRSLIKSEMNKLENREQLQGFEKVKKFVTVKEDFTIENGLLTSTMKLKRSFARNMFAKQIEIMYKQSKL